MSATDLGSSVVLLTGGSSGIGAAAVRSLHRAGASVFFTYLTHEKRAEDLVASWVTALRISVATSASTRRYLRSSKLA